MSETPKRLGTTRLEAFSDGVLAIILTIMVLTFTVPHTPDFAALQALWPVFLSYLLSFVYVGIYWNNHHHLFAAAEKINGGILWANLHLLFWLSLVPFLTGWMGENHFAALPTACYGIVLLMAAIAYKVLQWAILREPENGKLLNKALKNDYKGWVSPLLYIAGIACAFFSEPIANLFYTAVALLWLIPDRRIECAIAEDEQS